MPRAEARRGSGLSTFPHYYLYIATPNRWGGESAGGLRAPPVFRIFPTLTKNARGFLYYVAIPEEETKRRAA